MTEAERHVAPPSSDGPPDAFPSATLPVVHSLLDAAALLDAVLRAYTIAQPAACELFRSWANDVYRKPRHVMLDTFRQLMWQTPGQDIGGHIPVASLADRLPAVATLPSSDDRVSCSRYYH